MGDEDSELDAIRARRLAELQSKAGNEGSNEVENSRQREALAQQQEQMRQHIMARVLTSEARERLSRIAIVRPDKARGLEDLMINAAKSGQLRGSSPQGQVTESDLVTLLERINDQETSKNHNKIQFQRRGMLDDDEDDF